MNGSNRQNSTCDNNRGCNLLRFRILSNNRRRDAYKLLVGGAIALAGIF
jgi:hypothetical protein